MDHYRRKAEGQHIRRAQCCDILDVVQRNDSAAVIKYAAVDDQLPVMQKKGEFYPLERVLDTKEKKKKNTRNQQ